MFSCLSRPLSKQSYRLILQASHDYKTSWPTVSLKEAVSGSRRWISRSRDRKYGQLRCDRGLKTVCQGSETSQGESQKQQGGLDEKIKQSLLSRISEGLQDAVTKPEICTADELHYVAVPGTNWRLALWRYHPPPKAPKRNHPLLMLSGIGTNALGFDLEPSVSMARYMAETGFDTWILEVRGSGLSKTEAELGTEEEEEAKEESGSAEVIRNEDNAQKAEGNGAAAGNGSAVEFSNELGDQKAKTEDTSKQQQTVPANEQPDSAANQKEVLESSLKVAEGGVAWETWSTASSVTNMIVRLSEKLTRLLSSGGDSQTITARFVERISSLIELNLQSGRIAELRDWLASLVEAREKGTLIPSQIADLRTRLTTLLEEGQTAVTPRVSDLQERLKNTVDEFQKIVDLIAKYDWDFDDYLNEDVPTALDYIRKICKPVDGRVLSIGHSMGGIVLYAHLSTRGSNSGLAAAVSLASALDYGVSDTTLKLLMPLMDPAQALNVPVVPLGALMTAAQPLVSRPPYALAWVGYNVSAQNMMDQPLFNKLILNNFGTIPVKLLYHLSTVFQPGGLRSRDGSIRYKENISKCDVPVLALAADKDLICPPVAVLDTVEEFPKDIVTYKLFGGENDLHYGHYDLVCSPAAKREVFPYIRDFLVKNDYVREKEAEGNKELSKESG
ncbi:hypothetical protein R1sor_005915 [Riccia sorocarpa]|uniref:AB hydrolase-1 domain-containing protein n=1 Tax=Riccia sorocarpa TaxID=122646 RepID=A0ABD3HPM0_9MARC